MAIVSAPVTALPRSNALRAFRSLDYRRFLASRLLSILGLEMVNVAVGWQVYALTKRPLDLGYVGLAQFLPPLFLTLPAGHAADRFDRRRVVLLCHLAFGACSGLLAWLTLAQIRNPVPIFAVLVVLGCARAFNAPAAQALMPSLLPEADFTNAVAWNSSTFQVANIVGPALGGVLYAAFGNPEVVYILAASLAVLDVVVLTAVKTRTGRMEKKAASWSTVLAGVRYVWENKVVLGSVSLDLFAVLLGGAIALMPVFASDVLHTGAWGLGILRSGPAIGAGLVGLYLAAHPLKRHVGRTMLTGVAVFGVTIIAFGLSRTLWLSVPILIVMGGADMLSVFVRLTVVQISPPPEMRGRVNAVNMLFIGGSNELGEFESGLTAQWLGPVRAVIAGGVGTLLVVLTWSRLFPELRRLDRMPTESRTSQLERESTAAEAAAPSA
ncbi:MAG TPA: MFS transporter [Solirubrobacterales bacterium]|nr:MFS transporter [Solirubrobacterales bacterium]